MIKEQNLKMNWKEIFYQLTGIDERNVRSVKKEELID